MVLAAAAVATLEQKEQERQVLLDKVMTVARLHNLVMVVVVVQVLQVEMEIHQMEEHPHVQVELALQTTSLEQLHITAVAEVLREIREVV